MTKLENVKNGQKLENKWAKPENHNLRCKTAVMGEFDFSKKRKHSFIADTMLKIDQIKIKYGGNVK